MASHSARLRIHNSTQTPRIVWVEPWGEDYTLLPGKELEIVARNEAEQPCFSLVEWPQSTQVYLDGVSGQYEVIQDGSHLTCGHNRQAALDAGLQL